MEENNKANERIVKMRDVTENKCYSCNVGKVAWAINLCIQVLHNINLYLFKKMKAKTIANVKPREIESRT